MFWTIIIAIVVYITIRFFISLSKDDYDLQGQNLAEKFQFVVNNLNRAAFNGRGNVILLSKRSFNLYEDGQNQIIQFYYSTGHLTITWKYKYFHKEAIHERQFNDVRNLSLFEQQKIADTMINEMKVTVSNHQGNVLGNI